jgi:hypothetical protein
VGKARRRINEGGGNLRRKIDFVVRGKEKKSGDKGK